MRSDRVQGGNGFIGQNDGGVLVQRAGQCNALLLAAGELIAADIGLVQNADFIQRIKCGELLLFCIKAKEHLEKAHVGDHGGQRVFKRGCPGDQVEGLEDHADFAAEPTELSP